MTLFGYESVAIVITIKQVLNHYLASHITDPLVNTFCFCLKYKNVFLTYHNVL